MRSSSNEKTREALRSVRFSDRVTETAVKLMPDSPCIMMESILTSALYPLPTWRRSMGFGKRASMSNGSTTLPEKAQKLVDGGQPFRPSYPEGPPEPPRTPHPDVVGGGGGARHPTPLK